MPRYLVERALDEMDEEELHELIRRSKEINRERFPDITWERSDVVANEDGRMVSYCVYGAPNPDRIHEHSQAVGRQEIWRVYEIVGTLDPAAL